MVRCQNSTDHVDIALESYLSDKEIDDQQVQMLLADVCLLATIFPVCSRNGGSRISRSLLLTSNFSHVSEQVWDVLWRAMQEDRSDPHTMMP